MRGCGVVPILCLVVVGPQPPPTTMSYASMILQGMNEKRMMIRCRRFDDDDDDGVKVVDVSGEQRARRSNYQPIIIKLEDPLVGKYRCPHRNCWKDYVGVLSSEKGCNILQCRNHFPEYFYFCCHCKKEAKKGDANCNCRKRNTREARLDEIEQRTKRSCQNPIVLEEEKEDNNDSEQKQDGSNSVINIDSEEEDDDDDEGGEEILEYSKSSYTDTITRRRLRVVGNNKSDLQPNESRHFSRSKIIVTPHQSPSSSIQNDTPTTTPTTIRSKSHHHLYPSRMTSYFQRQPKNVSPPSSKKSPAPKKPFLTQRHLSSFFSK